MKKLEAAPGRVIVRLIDEDEVTDSPIIIPNMDDNAPEIGEVIHVGIPRRSNSGEIDSPYCKVGDVIVLPKFGTFRVRVNDEDYYVVSDNEVLAKIKEEK